MKYNSASVIPFYLSHNNIVELFGIVGDWGSWSFSRSLQSEQDRTVNGRVNGERIYPNGKELTLPASELGPLVMDYNTDIYNRSALPGDFKRYFEVTTVYVIRLVGSSNINHHMKVSEQCRIAASHGNQILGMIRRHITAIVRPHLEQTYICLRNRMESN